MSKQYKHILVPLDGSKLAETALDDALTVADLSQAEITLLQVVQPTEHVIGLNTDHPVYLDQQWASQKAIAQDYLADVQQQLKGTKISINSSIEMGPAAETIIDYATDYPVDLIVMATHGRSGIQRWVFGSVAEKVLRRANVPILLVRARQEELA